MAKHPDLKQILGTTTANTVVGTSVNPDRAGHEVYTYRKNTGDFTVYPVNPTIDEIGGVTIYPSLTDLPVVPDLVDVFRRSSELSMVLADVLTYPATTPDAMAATRLAR